MSAKFDPNAVTIAPEASAAAHRYWEERQKGKDVSVDDVLATAPGGAAPAGVDQSSFRATVISVIAQQAATLSGADIPQNSAAAVTQAGAPTAFDPKLTTVMSASGPLPNIEGYDLVACLGRGGMGAVYEGYQQSTGRRVAIKFMLDSLGATEAGRKRFEREVEVVARLQHPGIVSVIDSGVRKGRYYYVMEFVRGRPLDGAMPAGKTDPRKALELIARLCDAMDYAHQRGVLHRDLKPTNVIVDEEGVPHLLDFGLAKTFDPNAGAGESHGMRGLTVSGPNELLGTVAYMAPEQAKGQNDQTSVRTDVYSLGAIAYELITGDLPCKVSGSLREVLTRIIEIDPAAPSTIKRGLTRDLDAVLLKALEKNPDKRYPSAGEFAADIRRSLAGEPVIARRVGAAGKTWRWVKRNRAVSAVAAAAVVSLVVVSTVLIARVILESKRAAAERDLANENWARMKTMLTSVNPDENPGMTLLQLLDGATKSLADSPPARQLAEAQMREVLGDVYRRFAEYPKARDHLARVLTIREGVAAGADDPNLATALHNLAANFWWEGDYLQAESLYVRALKMREALAKKASSPKDKEAALAAVAYSKTHLAACKLRMLKIEEARELYQQALDMRRELYKNQDHEEVAQALNNLAKCWLEAEQLDRAENYFRQALAMMQRIEQGPKGQAALRGIAAASQNLADCMIRRSEAFGVEGDLGAARAAALEAREALDRAISIRRTAYPGGHHLLAASLCSMSRALVLLDELDQAESNARAGLQMYKVTRPAPDSPDHAEGLESLGVVLLAKGDLQAAAPLLEDALRIARNVRPPEQSRLHRLRSELGLALATSGRAEEGESLLIRALEDTRGTRGENAVETALAARRLVEYYSVRGEPQRADPYRALARLGPAN